MIGIISDTHDNVQNIKKAVEIFKKRNVELVIHCGDVVAPLSVRFFKGLKVHFVKGNCDGDSAGLRKLAEEDGSVYEGETFEITINDKKIFAAHLPLIAEQAKGFDYILHGHTHEKRDERIGNTRIINPGGNYAGDQEHSIAVLDIKTDSLEFIDLK